MPFKTTAIPFYNHKVNDFPVKEVFVYVQVNNSDSKKRATGVCPCCRGVKIGIEKWQAINDFGYAMIGNFGAKMMWKEWRNVSNSLYFIWLYDIHASQVLNIF